MSSSRVGWIALSLVLGCIAQAPLAAEGGSESEGEEGSGGVPSVPAAGASLVEPNLEECEHCDDGNACTVDRCHPTSGECFSDPRVCDDGLGCTEDSCDPDSGCVFDPVDAMCPPGPDCVTASVCSPSMPAPIVMGTWNAVPSAVGCWHFNNDAWCVGDDGCACNGAEVCTGWAGTLPGGCDPAPRMQWPCESDGDACTEENCCEPWNPEGCRMHAQMEAAMDGDDPPPLAQFCENVGSTQTVNSSLGAVECVTGALQYTVNVPDAILDDFAPNKDPGYWCNDCRPCTVDDCDPNTGVCDPGNRIGEVSAPDPAQHTDAFGGVCPVPQSCIGEANFGCGRFECIDGVCAAPANPANEDSSVSDACHGFPVREVSTEDADAVVPAETCFEVGCVDVTLTESGETVPFFQCVAMPRDELCDSNDVCTEGVCDGADICPGDCTPAQLANLLVGNSTSRSDTPPMPGTVILGCSESDVAEACDDGVECTVDGCDPVAGCVHAPDDRTCPNLGAPWQPCDFWTYCSEEGCLLQEDDPCRQPGDPEPECALECIEDGQTRTCMGYDECSPDTCTTEGFMTLSLGTIVDQCPWLPEFMPNPGDSDFDGNGPLVNIEVALSISPDQHSIYAWIDFEARETKSDFSTLQVPLPPVVVATTGATIVDILSDRTGTARGLATSDLGGFVDFTSLTGIVTGASVRGDTLYGDISDDPNCHDDTWIEEINLGSVEISFTQDCFLE